MTLFALEERIAIITVSSFSEAQCFRDDAQYLISFLPVLLGRLSFVCWLAGNQRFRLIVDRHVERYSQSTTTKLEKKMIVSSIVDEIRERGGSFVRQGTEQWLEVGDKVSIRDMLNAIISQHPHTYAFFLQMAREKVGQAIRSRLRKMKPSGAKAGAVQLVLLSPECPLRHSPRDEIESYGSKRALREEITPRDLKSGNFSLSLSGLTGLTRANYEFRSRRNLVDDAMGHVPGLRRGSSSWTESRGTEVADCLQRSVFDDDGLLD